MIHPGGTVNLTEASLDVEAVGRIRRPVGITGGGIEGMTGGRITIELTFTKLMVIMLKKA